MLWRFDTTGLLARPKRSPVDSFGNAYLTGWTAGGNITTPGAFQTTAYGLDAYVAEVNPSGNSLVYATYLGGSCKSAPQLAGDTGYGIALDPAGDTYITGQACSQDFPVTDNAIQTKLEGTNTNYSAFLSELDPSGSRLLFGTYIGGSYTGDWASGIGLDRNLNAYIAGLTHSATFPTTTGALQKQNLASDQGAGFVSKFSIPQGGTILIHDFALTLTPSSATITRGRSTTTIVTINPTNGFYQQIAFSCSGIPSWAQCSFSKPFVAPNESMATTTMTIETISAASIKNKPSMPFAQIVSIAALFCWLGLGRRRRRTLELVLICLVAGGVLAMDGCGGGGGGGVGGGSNPASFTVTITGVAPSTEHTITFVVTAN